MLRTNVRTCIIFVVCAALLFGCTSGRRHSANNQATVTASGFTVRLGDATVSGGRGVAPEGTPVAVAKTPSSKGRDAVPAQLARLTVASGDGITVRLGEREQPATAVTIALVASPPPTTLATPVMLRVSEDGSINLLSATYDAASSRMVATTDHLSDFYPQWLDPRPFFKGIGDALSLGFGLSTPKPGCSGQGVVSTTAGELTLPRVYLRDGDRTVWPCLRIVSDSPERIELQLTSNTGIPYRVRATGEPQVVSGGSIELAKAGATALYDVLLKSPQYSEELLIPTGSLTLTWPASGFPVDVALKADAITHLVFILAAAVTAIADEAGGRVMAGLQALACLKAVVDGVAPNEDDRGPDKISAEVAGSVLTGVFSCATTVAGNVLSSLVKFVLSVLGSGTGLFLAALDGALRTATANDLVEFRLGSTQSPPSYSGTVSLMGKVESVAVGTVKAGQRVGVSATGLLGYGYEGTPDCVGFPTTDADGNRSVDGRPCQPKIDPLTPLPSAPVGSLLASVSAQGPWELVGSRGSFVAPSSGTLYFAYNDPVRIDDTGFYTISYRISG